MNYTKIYKNKKILVTGHTGFKGFWLILWLKKMGAEIYGISLNKHNNKSKKIIYFYNKNIKNFYFDITSFKKTSEVILKIKPDFIFHLAAQAIVSDSYKKPKQTWLTNVIGTQAVLESLRVLNSKCICIFITSDKCYENNELIRGYKESDRLGGSDPYSSSKASCELLIKSYYESFFSKHNKIKIATARAGNVIGGNDWSELRLMPDIVKSWSKNLKVNIRNLNSTRPWQHVLEPINGYLKLASKLKTIKSINGQSYNFGPSEIDNFSVEFILKKCSKLWDNKKWKITKNKFKESTLLNLNSDKAYKHLKWKQSLNINQTLKLTINWYKKYFDDEKNIIKNSYEQINYFENLKKK